MHDPVRDRETLRAGFARTLSGDQFARAHALGAEPAASPEAPPPGAPAPRQEPIADRLAAHGLPTRRAAGARFEVVAVLGEGANGRIVCARDRDLGRDVAVKFLKLDPGADATAIDGFLDEARTTASLDHPNVPPVHDVDVNEGGLPYFSMKRIVGRSLGDAIAASTAQARHGAIATPNRVVSVVVAVAHALAYAHHRGVVHQDVKPDNVMLGEFGEVLLVDWGSAARLDDAAPKLYGTPLYMSPEQARRERSDARSDVYALGATLFHALLLRVPTWSDDVEEFWRRKRAGELDAPTPDERRRAPAALIGIALKAMAAQPRDRYRRVEDLAADLEHYQAGLAVSAHREPLLARLARWHRRNARWLWSALTAAGALAALAAVFYGERLKEMATWGQPVLVERFAPGWRDRWLPVQGEVAEVRGGGGIVSRGPEGDALMLRRPLDGDVAIEFDGKVEPHAFACDLSFVWDRGGEPESRIDKLEDMGNGLMFAQFGAHGNAYSLIMGPDGEQLAFSDVRMEVDRWYRVRLEIVGPSLELSVDGRRICRYVDAFPLGGGHVGLYTFGGGKRIREVRIYQRSLPEKVSVVAIPDELVRERRYEDAGPLYARIAHDHPASPIADEAEYKRGLCAFSAGHDAEADAIWSRLPPGRWRERSRWHGLDRLIAAGDDARIAAALADAARSPDADVRDGVATRWAVAVRRLVEHVRVGDAPTAALKPYLAALDGPLGGLSIVDQQAAFAFNLVGEGETTIARYPRQLPAVFEAYALLGRSDEVVARWPRNADAIPDYVDCARWDEMRAAFGDNFEAPALAAQGRFDVLADWSGDLPRQVTGRMAETIAQPGFNDMHARALILLGRADEVPLARRACVSYQLCVAGGDAALAHWGDHYQYGTVARHLAGLEAFIAGDRARAFALFAPRRGLVGRQPMSIFARFVMAPFLHELAGDAGALDRACAETMRSRRWLEGQRPWHDARWLRGEIDDAAYLAQPHRGWAEARLTLLRAVRAERSGERDAALAQYRAYLAIPAWRRSEDLDPIERRFSEWRIAELSRSQGAEQPPP